MVLVNRYDTSYDVEGSKTQKIGLEMPKNRYFNNKKSLIAKYQTYST